MSSSRFSSINAHTSQTATGDHPLLKLYIAKYTVTVIVSLLLLMLLIWHISTTQLVEKFDMPHVWESDFKRQQLDGVKVWIWSVVLVVVPINLVHALLCLGWYHGRLDMTKKAAKRKDEDKTSARFLCNFLPRYIGQKMEREESGIEMVRNAQYATQATTHHQTLLSTPHVRTGIHLPTNGDLVLQSQSIRSHICHPLLPSDVSPITHMFFLTLYDTLIILILTLHIVAFASNIAPSLAFCSTPAAINYPPWAFHDSSGTDWTDGSYAKDSMGMDRGGRKVQLGMRERCQRINWGISTAGGWGCGGAAMLAALHVAGLGMRMWEVWGPEGSRDVEKRKHGMEEEGLDRSMETRLKEEEWENAPKDINIQTHATRPHVLSSSVSTPSAHPTTISEEEHNIGVRERDKRSAGQERRTEYKSESKSSEDLPTSSIRQAKWMETLLECLVP